MFDQIDSQLQKWIESVLDKVEVTFLPPSSTLSGQSVCLYLLEVAAEQKGRGIRLPPLLMTLRYLIVPSILEPQENHKILGKLLIAALENTEFEVEKEPFPLSAWTAFGLAPRPSFILRVPFKYERHEKLAPPVKQPLVLKPTTLHSLSGQILGEDLPLMNAQVNLPEFDRSTITDYQGRFQFSAVPAEPSAKKLIVRARGREFIINIDQRHRSGEGLLINLRLEE
jgi:hypothetical protein